MQKMNFKLLTITVLTIATSACGSHKTESQVGVIVTSGSMVPVAERTVTPVGDSIVTVDFSKVSSNAVLRATDLLDDLKIVRLDNSTKEALISGYGNIWVTPNRIMVGGENAIKQFDHSGKYLGDLIKRGQGPGEYPIALYDVYADEDAARIYAVEFNAKKVHTYDTEGNFLGDIPLAYEAPKAFIRADTENQRLTISTLQFKRDETFPIIWEQDFDGNVISSVIREDLNVGPDFSNELYFSTTDNGFNYSRFLITPEPDTLYAYSDGKLRPEMTVNFGDKTPWHSLISFPRFYIAITNGDEQYVGANTFVIPSNAPVLIDKQSLTGTTINLMLDNIGPIMASESWTYGKSPEYIALSLNPGDLADKIDELPDDVPGAEAADYERAKQFRETINPDDNNYLVIGRWKK